ncbi:MAG: hypothetical protein GC190_20450 [Alphaproteobacteria bacterium]|nr:hypothetical protein [Alphaproteobacteria bacterium]
MLNFLSRFWRRAWFWLYVWPKAKRIARTRAYWRWSEITVEFTPWNRSLYVSEISGPQCVMLDKLCRGIR